MPPKLPASALDSDRIDDRWTLSKLAAAGYEYSGERTCNRGCGEPVAFYKKPAASHKGRDGWLVLDPATLEVHDC